MTTRVRTVMKLTAAFAVLAAFVGAAPPLHAQSKPSSSARIPFFSDAVGEPLNEREDTQIAVFKDEVPAGKRLVVQFVSVSGRGSVTLTDNDPPEELIFAKCHITGRGIGVDFEWESQACSTSPAACVAPDPFPGNGDVHGRS